MRVSGPRKKLRTQTKDSAAAAPLPVHVSGPREPDPSLDGTSHGPRRLSALARGGALSLTLSILLTVAVVAVIIAHPDSASPLGSQELASNQHGGTLTSRSPTSPPSLPTSPALPTLRARPAISQYAVLFAVDTAGPNVAWATGRTLDASGQQISLLARYSGGTWTQDNSPGATIPHTALYGIAMVSATEGWAVGGTFDVPPFTSVILHYTAGRWTRIAGPPNATLRAISMDAPNDGWAVGQTDDASSNTQAIFLHYDGTRWNVVPTTLHAGIMAIDMQAANDGWAAGYTGQGMLILHYDGLQWTSIPTPFDHTATAELSGISLANANSGWAVGAIYGPNFRTVLLAYQAGRWQEASSPLPTTYLSEVRMLAPDDAWAVGDTTDPSYHSVLLHFHNGSWQPLASPANATLRAIAFSSANTGWAVGGLPNGGLILHDAGGAWSSIGS